MIPLLALLQGAIPTTPMELIRESTAITRVVLAVLAVLSLISWAVILLTWVRLVTANGRAQKFAEEFEKLKRLDEGVSLARRSAQHALSRLLLRASHFVVETRGASLRIKETVTQDTGTLPNVTLTGSQLEALHLAGIDIDANQLRSLGRLALIAHHVAPADVGHLEPASDTHEHVDVVP